MLKLLLVIALGMLFTSCKPTMPIASNSTTPDCNDELKKRVESLEMAFDTLLNYRIETKLNELREQYANDLKNNGALGDVKYSMLGLKQIREQNGDCWILLDSAQNNEAYLNSDLFALYKQVLPPSLPTGTGRFIRGMMERRDTITSLRPNWKDLEDPEGVRTVGAFQQDTIANHYHGITMPARWGAGNQGNSEDVTAFTAANNPYRPNGRADVLTPTKMTNIFNNVIETRPRNIALYIYIRVNLTCK